MSYFLIFLNKFSFTCDSISIIIFNVYIFLNHTFFSVLSKERAFGLIYPSTILVAMVFYLINFVF